MKDTRYMKRHQENGFHEFIKDMFRIAFCFDPPLRKRKIKDKTIRFFKRINNLDWFKIYVVVSLTIMIYYFFVIFLDKKICF